MKVNISSNNGIVRPVPGTKFMTPVYGKDLSEAQIIRLLNFPALRIYRSKDGVIINKRNVNDIFNEEDFGSVTNVEHADIADKKFSSKVNSVKSTDVPEKPVEVEEEEVKEKTIDDATSNENITNVAVDTDDIDATDVVSDTDTSDANEEVETEQVTSFNNQQNYRKNKKKR